MSRYWLAAVLLAAAISYTGCRRAEEPKPPETALFVSGADGYHTYRIPSLIVTKAGTVLAFCEGRKQSLADSGDIDLLVKRSEDGGATWSGQQVVWDDGPNTCGNPCPVIDERNGRIVLLLTWNRGDDRGHDLHRGAGKDTRRVFVLTSDDDGRTWRPAGATPRIGDRDGGLTSSDPKLVPLGERVACLWTQFDRVHFATTDGTRWTEPQRLPARRIHSAASPDGRTVLAVVSSRKEKGARVLRGNRAGGKWTRETTIPAPGWLTVQPVSGRAHLVYVVRDGGGSRVFVRSRAADGTWSEPRVIFTPPAGQPRDMPLTLAVSRFSPEQFVPVAVFGLRGKSAWKDILWAQVVKVPTHLLSASAAGKENE